MTAVDIPVGAPGPLRRDELMKWRRRSRLVRTLRLLLPAAIGAVFAVLATFVAYRSITGVRAPSVEQNAPIRLINPRFYGRDDKGRAFVLTAATAVRDQNEYKKIYLERPALVMDENGPDTMRVSGRTGIFHEATKKLYLAGGVKLSGTQSAFETDSSVFDTATGELAGAAPIQGAGSLGEITAKSYGVYEKGDRMVFKGGVRARIDNN